MVAAWGPSSPIAVTRLRRLRHLQQPEVLNRYIVRSWIENHWNHFSWTVLLLGINYELLLPSFRSDDNISFSSPFASFYPLRTNTVSYCSEQYRNTYPILVTTTPPAVQFSLNYANSWSNNNNNNNNNGTARSAKKWGKSAVPHSVFISIGGGGDSQYFIQNSSAPSFRNVTRQL